MVSVDEHTLSGTLSQFKHLLPAVGNRVWTKGTAVLRFPASVPAGNARVRSDGQTEIVAQGFLFVWQVNPLKVPPRFLHTQLDKL